MLTNEQRAHDIAMLQLNLNIPIIQKNFTAKAIADAGVSVTDMYIEQYSTILNTLNEKLSPAQK